MTLVVSLTLALWPYTPSWKQDGQKSSQQTSHLAESLGSLAQPGVHQQSAVLPVGLVLLPPSLGPGHSSRPPSLLPRLWRSSLAIRHVTPLSVTRLVPILRTVVLAVNMDNLLVTQVAFTLIKISLRNYGLIF